MSIDANRGTGNGHFGPVRTDSDHPGHSRPGHGRLGGRQPSGTGVMASGLGRRMAIAGLAAALIWLAVAWALAS